MKYSIHTHLYFNGVVFVFWCSLFPHRPLDVCSLSIGFHLMRLHSFMINFLAESTLDEYYQMRYYNSQFIFPPREIFAIVREKSELENAFFYILIPLVCETVVDGFSFRAILLYSQCTQRSANMHTPTQCICGPATHRLTCCSVLHAHQLKPVIYTRLFIC